MANPLVLYPTGVVHFHLKTHSTRREQWDKTFQKERSTILARPWYVQNVSTFLNTFAIVSPLICVFWIQLTRTNVVFSRISLVSCFCAEIRLSGKIPKNTAKFLFYQKTHGARVRDGEGPQGAHTTWWRGPGQAAPGGGVAAPDVTSSPPFAYIYPLT
jgi:hypothetical protein